jgi:hypothetical protein
MAFVTWEWNTWLDAHRDGNSDLLVCGLALAVRTHPFIRGKPSGRLQAEYRFDSAEEIEQEVAIKILRDATLMDGRDNGLNDHEIGQRINRIITNFLLDCHDRREVEKRIFAEISYGTTDEDEEEMGDGLSRMLDRRLRNLSYSPEGQCVLRDLLNHFTGTLTPRQIMIFEEHKKFGQGEMTTAELVGKLGVQKSTLCEEIRRMKKKLAFLIDHQV